MVEVERAQPWLGTRVAVRVSAKNGSVAHAAIDAAFGVVAEIHHRLSFHELDSLLSRLNRQACHHPVTVDLDTWRLLCRAKRIARWSRGVFDPTVAPRLVAAGVLPVPQGAGQPDPDADWRDIELLPDCRVRWRRPLWCDLGGIAKGHAVDRAVARLRAAGIRSGRVDAGGDQRMFGRDVQAVTLPADGDGRRSLWLRNAAVTGSSTIPTLAVGERSGKVLHGQRDEILEPDLEVIVIAPRAWLADALTKWVLGAPGQAGRVAEWGAQTIVRSAATPWQLAA